MERAFPNRGKNDAVMKVREEAPRLNEMDSDPKVGYLKMEGFGQSFKRVF
jgi:hypothetical protein